MHAKDSEKQAFPALLIGILMLISYALIYWLNPFSQSVNQFLLGSLTLAASAFVSIFSTMIYRLHLPGDAPRPVWRNFAIGFWLWTIAEFFWLWHGLEIGRVSGTASGLTISHLFWLTAYIFFSMALYRQHRIIASQGRAHGPWIVALIWALVLIVTWITMILMGEPKELLTFVQYFSGFADLAIGIIGLTMLLAFSGGAMAWPWWGFVGLAISNILYEILDATMMATVAPVAIEILELLSELTYIGAYLALAYGFYKYYLLLIYGPRIKIASLEPK